MVVADGQLLVENEVNNGKRVATEPVVIVIIDN